MGRFSITYNVPQPRAVADCEAFNCQAKIIKLRERKAQIQQTNGNSFWVLLAVVVLSSVSILFCQ
jgi:hypothetical protein